MAPRGERWLVLLGASAALGLSAGVATAQELLGTTCSGPEPAATAVAPPTATGPDLRDLALGLVVLGIGVAGIQYARANERWRRDRSAIPRAVERAPYACGGALGALIALSLIFLGHPVGVSGGIESLARGELSWQTWIVAGVFLGALGGAALGGRVRVGFGPPEGWRGAFGSSVALRLGLVFVACAAIEIASLIAGGCTSGLALSGGITLAPGAFVFMAAMFASGIPTAHLVARRGSRTP